ncbi:MAG: hypothetical protein WCK05_04115 [Planctomycetota bacterium]
MSSQGVRTLVYTAVGAALAGGVVFAAVLAGRMTEAAMAAAPGQKAYLVRLAWVCVVAGAVVALALIWVVMRFLSFRLAGEAKRMQTEHVDAWTLSGQRFQMTKEEEERLESTWGDEEEEKP